VEWWLGGDDVRSNTSELLPANEEISRSLHFDPGLRKCLCIWLYFSSIRRRYTYRAFGLSMFEVVNTRESESGEVTCLCISLPRC
jgi:hypothetical protein